MADDFRLSQEARSEMISIAGFQLVDITDINPVRAHGWLGDHYWYFQSPGTSWSFEIGGAPDFTRPPIWWRQKTRSKSATSTDQMSHEEVVTFILEAIEEFRSMERVTLAPGHADYGNHMLRAWSDGLISASTVGEYFGLNVIQVVELGLMRGLPQPWTATPEVQRYISKLAKK